MPRLRDSVSPEKRRKTSFFSKFRKRTIESPGVVDHGVQNHGSDSLLAGISSVPVFCAIDHWHRRQGLGNEWYQNPASNAIILKFINVLGIVYTMGWNTHTATFRSGWDVYYAGLGGKQTYFTPAPWSFLMWPVIHALILGGCIYQFSHQGSSVFVDQVGWKLPLLQISNAIYVRSRSSHSYKYAFIWIVVTYVVVNKIYRKLSKTPLRSIRDQLFCHLPFSLYHGWVLGLVFLAGFEAFGVDAVATPAHSGTKIFVLVSFVLIQLFEWAYASPVTKGDFFACLAVSWFLFAITVQQSAVRSAFVHWSAHGFTLFSLCWITKCMIGLEMRDI